MSMQALPFEQTDAKQGKVNEQGHLTSLCIKQDSIMIVIVQARQSQVSMLTAVSKMLKSMLPAVITGSTAK